MNLKKNLVYYKYAFRNIPVCISPNYVICFRLTTSHIQPIALINNTGECRIVVHIGTEGSESDESDGDSVINYESDDDSNGDSVINYESDDITFFERMNLSYLRYMNGKN